MKLYEVPRNTKINSPLGILNFSHIDGMYSYCVNEKNEVVHLAAFTEVEIIKEKKNESAL